MKLLAATAILVTAAATSLAAPMGTAFTWQGTLATGGVRVDGSWDLRFTLYDAPDAAVPAAGPVTVEDVPVEHGRATVAVDFGAVFDGSDLWLEVAGRPGASGGGFTVLRPRQPLGSTPFAHHVAEADTAGSAEFAATAIAADTLEGEHAAYYQIWGNLTGVPADLADGDDDTLAALACTAGELVTWNGSAWVCDADDEPAYARTVVVGPVGDAAANGAALLAAVAALPTPATPEGAWQIRIEPGTYDLGTASLVMKPWLSVAGAGREATVITSARCCGETDALYGTVVAAAGTELSDLTVLNTCDPTVADQQSAAVSSSQTGAVFRRLRVYGFGTAEYEHGLVSTGADAVIEQVVAAGGSPSAEFGCGVTVAGANSFLLDVSATGTHTGLRILRTSSHVLRGSFLAMGGGLPGIGLIGIELEGADVEIADATADGATAVSAAAYTASGNLTLSRVTANGAVVGRANPGNTLKLVLEHSRVDSSGATLDIGANVLAGVAASQLAGGPMVVGGGAVACAGVWDESWTFSANVCP